METVLIMLSMLQVALAVMVILLMLARHYKVKYRSWKMWAISTFGVLVALLFGKLVGFI